MSDPFVLTVPLEAVLQLLLASIVVKVTPGPGVTATVARSLARGTRGTLPFVLGITAADFTMVILVLSGLAAVASHFEQAFTIARYIGAGYLIYVGVRFWMASNNVETEQVASKADWAKTWLSGYVLTMSNPKAVLFYGALLPLFIDITQITWADGLLIIVLMSTDIFVILFGYAALASRARHLFQSTRGLKWLNRTAGTVMAGAGVMVASQ